MRHPFFFRLSASLTLCLLSLSACGKTELPSDLAETLGSQAPGRTSSPSASSTAEADMLKAIPQILLGLEEIRQEIKGLKATGIQPIQTAAAKPSAGSKPGTTTSRPSSGTSRPTTSTPKPATSPKPAATASATSELKAVIAQIQSAPFIQAQVEKTERNLSTGKTSTVKLTMSMKQPSQVKLDVSYSSSGASGAKVLYQSGDTNKAKVRPGGSMSFITTELPKTDERLVSLNGYKFDDIDFFGVSKRFAQGYKAELVGKSQLNGTEIHVLKLSTTGTNALDGRIAYEYIGFEPDTHTIRLWEIYDTSGAESPYFRLVLPKVSFPSTLPDSAFKL
ncbi:MAG: hypothetical protein ACO1RX_07045 [Candidatus Sericytochromatia bacterium]